MKWTRIACTAAVMILATATLADAIPAFSRRYQTSCTTCHVVVPKLNPFGLAFRNNGYRIPPYDEPFVKTPDVPLGAPGWKRLWPDAIWPGGIPGLVPLAFRIFSDTVVNPSAPVRLDFVFPQEFELLVGGTAGDHVSYFGELEVRPNDRLQLARAFVQFDHLGGSTLANLVVGRFEPRVVPFSRYWRRLTASNFLTSRYRAVESGFDFVTSQAGFEWWGARSGPADTGGFEYAAGLVNGNGPFSDNNTAKDVYYRASYKLGGHGVSGNRVRHEAETLAPVPRVERSVRFGTFGYRGDGLFGEEPDRFWRVGGDVDVVVADLNLFATAWRGRDTPTGTASMAATAASIEGDYAIKPWVIAILRYEGVFRDDAPDITRAVPALVVAIRANVRVVAEVERYFAASGDSRARVRLDVVF